MQDVRERGTTHRASQITPLSESPDLLTSVYTVQRSHHRSLRESDSLPSVLYSYIPLSRPRRVYQERAAATALSATSPRFCVLLLPSCLRPLRSLLRDADPFVSLSFIGDASAEKLFFLSIRFHPPSSVYPSCISSRFPSAGESTLSVLLSFLLYIRLSYLHRVTLG